MYISCLYVVPFGHFGQVLREPVSCSIAAICIWILHAYTMAT